MKIQIICDNPNSWMIDYLPSIINEIHKFSNNVKLCSNHEQIEPGDILFLLSCEKKLDNLDLNKFNLVVHESDLPRGKGWSPLTWQILEGKNIIPITLLEAHDEIDSGNIYFQEFIQLDGHELVDELRAKQVNSTINLMIKFLENYPSVYSYPQQGSSSFYHRRKPIDSRLDIQKSILEQFNLLRVSDNERYPAFFEHLNNKYIIKIEKVK